MRKDLSLQTRGFTLIELLVVVTIISLLTSVVLSSLALARAKSRDARRLEDIHQVQVALELYHSNYDVYPVTPPGLFWQNCGGTPHGNSGPSGWIPNLAPGTMPVLPSDPNPILPNNCYAYQSNGTDYMILAYGTVESYTTATNPKTRPYDRTEPDFAAYTPGAELW